MSSVILERRADQVVLIVEDDGVGFDPGDAATTRQGLGLSGMQERASLVGATIANRVGGGQRHDDPRAHGVRSGRNSTPPTMSEHALRILLADDHVTVRHGLKLLIDSQPDMKVVSEASDGNAAVQNAIA